MKRQITFHTRNTAPDVRFVRSYKSSKDFFFTCQFSATRKSCLSVEVTIHNYDGDNEA